MQPLHDIEEQEIGAVIQKIIETVCLAEGDRTIHRVAIQSSFDMRVLIGKDELGMIEVDLDAQILFFIEEISQAVIVLGNGKRFVEESIVPSAVIDAPDRSKSVIISDRRLGDMHVATRVPFGIVSPGKIELSFMMRLLILRLSEKRNDQEQ